jgi:proteasome lid subunit RPN8/RPN11
MIEPRGEGDSTNPADSDTSRGQEAAVEVRQAVLDDVVAHARTEAPNECCGVLIGSGQRVDHAVRARNLLSSPTRYQIDPVDQFAAIKAARESGREVVGFYHSHPASSPTPSATDREEAAYPGYYYLIVSPGSLEAPAEVRAFRLQHSGNFLRIRLVPFR